MFNTENSSKTLLPLFDELLVSLPESKFPGQYLPTQYQPPEIYFKLLSRSHNPEHFRRYFPSDEIHMKLNILIEYLDKKELAMLINKEWLREQEKQCITTIRCAPFKFNKDYLILRINGFDRYYSFFINPVLAP